MTHTEKLRKEKWQKSVMFVHDSCLMDNWDGSYGWMWPVMIFILNWYVYT